MLTLIIALFSLLASSALTPSPSPNHWERGASVASLGGPPLPVVGRGAGGEGRICAHVPGYDPISTGSGTAQLASVTTIAASSGPFDARQTMCPPHSSSHPPTTQHSVSCPT